MLLSTNPSDEALFSHFSAQCLCIRSLPQRTFVSSMTAHMMPVFFMACLSASSVSCVHRVTAADMVCHAHGCTWRKQAPGVAA